MTFVIATTALLLAVPAHADDSRTAPTNKSVPPIARVGKVQIGYSTQEDLARRWGEGKTVTGGHPNSGRVWRVRGTSWWITTDGFDYSQRGLVVDQLSLTTRAGLPADAPYTKLAGKDFAWLGEISPGMDREHVLQILKRKSVPIVSKTEGYEVNASGFYPLTSVITPLRNWKAVLKFTNDVLTELSIEGLHN